jgi:hypothetical protein
MEIKSGFLLKSQLTYGFAKQSDLRWISTKFSDVVSNPLQRHVLILQPSIARNIQVWIIQAQEANGTETVVECDHHDVFLKQKIGSVEIGFAGQCLE